MKRTKSITIDDDVFEYTNKQGNASQYIEDLVRADMQRVKQKKEAITDFAKINDVVSIDEDAKQKREEERKARRAAWDSLDIEVTEVIKEKPSWGELWKNIYYPLYLKNGNKLTVMDVINEVI